MTKEKVLEVIGVYRLHCKSLGILKKKINPNIHFDLKVYQENMGLDHLHAMLDEMEQFIKEGQMEKVFRWLGFIQGVLWAFGHFTLNELKDHNLPKEAE